VSAGPPVPGTAERIDLHLHTTASDGQCTPAALVSLAAQAGLSGMVVTDHDTVAGLSDARAEAARCGIEFVPGIEVTAVEDGQDVHVLGYFIDPDDGALATFLAAQRESRVERVRAIGARLASLGRPIDTDAILAGVDREGGRSVGRPQVARAMIAAGHAADMQEVFDRWLGRGGPAFVRRRGPSPEAVIDIIHRAGGLVSLAHPGRTGIDDRIPAFREAGLDALEVHHTDHDAALVAHYGTLASRLGLLHTGGSDFHGDLRLAVRPGSTVLPPEAWHAFRQARRRHACP
jgi:3',5'-nucleoside bisphosphate phosphatase